MNAEKNENEGKWAPWYVYVVLIVGANLLKQKLIEGVPAIANIAITLVLVAALIVGITAVYRAMTGGRQRQR
ncbi:hypothetical protein [Amycolatopsis benzoatilytica]|uniref:hypothetical protein n=1 Tax=Amycolatopsis benzoatilytica TaxID=346045 RepID=UPI00035FFA69|nr:hypothetical protein [Amycolatopsis benzoatilytica]